MVQLDLYSVCYGAAVVGSLVFGWWLNPIVRSWWLKRRPFKKPKGG